MKNIHVHVYTIVYKIKLHKGRNKAQRWKNDTTQGIKLLME